MLLAADSQCMTRKKHYSELSGVEMPAKYNNIVEDRTQWFSHLLRRPTEPKPKIGVDIKCKLTYNDNRNEMEDKAGKTEEQIAVRRNKFTLRLYVTRKITNICSTAPTAERLYWNERQMLH